MKILTEVSARHIHLSQKDLEKLFGKNHKLKPIKKLSQPGEFASKETVTITSGKNKIENVRVLGPTRNKSQLEISQTDAFKLKINPPLRISGDLADVKKIKVKGKKGTAMISTIIAKRHIHLSEKESKKYKLKNKQKVSVKMKTKRPVTFNDVQIRVKPEYKSSFHLDTDEGNAAGIKNKTYGEIVK